MDNTLYTEVVFNQIAPDYLEGLLLIMPGEQIDQNFVYDIAKVSFYQRDYIIYRVEVP